jgi:putative oxidoreductase
VDRVIKRILTPSPISVDLGLLAARLAVGSTLAIHGWAKMRDIQGFVPMVRSLDFPVPEVFAWAAAISEFFGGIFIAAGLLSRAASLFAGVTMAVAALKYHGNVPFTNNLDKQFEVVLLASCGAFFLAGPGKYALDAAIASGSGGGRSAKGG